MASIEQNYAWMERYTWTIHKNGSVSAALLPDSEQVDEGTLEAAKERLAEATHECALRILGIKGNEQYDQIEMTGPLLREIRVDETGKMREVGAFKKYAVVYFLEGYEKTYKDESKRNSKKRSLEKMEITYKISLGKSKERVEEERAIEAANILIGIGITAGVEFNDSIDRDTMIFIESTGEGEYKVVRHAHQRQRAGFLTLSSLQLIKQLKGKHNVLSKIFLTGMRRELEGATVIHILTTLLASEDLGSADRELEKFAEEHKLLIRLYGDRMGEIVTYDGLSSGDGPSSGKRARAS